MATSEEQHKASIALMGSGLGGVIGGGLGLAKTHRGAIQWGIMGMTTGAILGGVIGKATYRSPMKVGVVPLRGGGILGVSMNW